MPARRKPAAVQEKNGAWAKNPQRRREDPPTAGPIGDPPPTLPENLHAVWHELIANAPVGVLKSRDRFVLETTVRVLHELRTSSKFQAATGALLHKCLVSLGMTPADASRAHVPTDNAENPFAKFAKKAAAARKQN